MKHFFKLKTRLEVLEIIQGFAPLAAQETGLAQALDRVLAQDVSAAEDLPAFPRSTMDGFAIRAEDTFGVSEGLPGLFEVAGEIRMGQAPGFRLGRGQAARIWTGGMLPVGSDAVVMLEYSRQVDETQVELTRPAAPFEHVIRPGEDVAQGQTLLTAGRRLRPQDLGLLAALGHEAILVRRRPRLGLISTGDEIVPAGAAPRPGQVRDINTHTLAALAARAGAQVVPFGLAGDDEAALKSLVKKAQGACDLLAISGGSSVGVRDHTLQAFASLAEPELLVHGVSVSPGKPFILARSGAQPLVGLPGHVVSAMITFQLFVRPLIERLSGLSPAQDLGAGKLKARLTRNTPSAHGREDFVRVSLEPGPGGELRARPILGKSGLISTMVKADGIIMIGLNEEGLGQGAEVEVTLLN